MSRQTKTLLPTMAQQLKPKITTDTQQERKKNKEKQASYYNRSVKQRAPLEEGDTVRIKPQIGKLWTKGRVEKRVTEPRSYTIRTEEGRVYRRNTGDLKKTEETFEETPPQVIEPHIDTTEVSAGIAPPNITENTTAAEVCEPPEDIDPPTEKPRTTKSGRVINIPSRYR